MKSEMQIGLTLGKFAPLHLGHEWLIQTCVAEMDHTIVLVYDMPELDVPPLPIRVQWIKHRFPTVEVLEAWDGPTQTGLTPDITALHDAYLQKKLAGRKITHFYSSEPYGEHVSRALGAIDRRVDQARARVPISATELRQDLYRYRSYVNHQVYRDLIIKVVFLGAPSTGKTTLAEELARRFQTSWMPEYGREYWERNQVNRRLSPEQMIEIAHGHREREDALVLDANKYLFVDTDATTTLQFAKYYHETALPELERLADECRDRYDVVFLCGDEIPYDDTWDRSGDASRLEMQRRIVSDLRSRRRPFHLLSGSLEERCRRVSQVLESFRKFGP